MNAKKELTINSINVKLKGLYGRLCAGGCYKCCICDQDKLKADDFAVHFFNFHSLELSEKEKKLLVDYVLDDAEEQGVLIDNSPVPFYPGIGNYYCPSFTMALSVKKFCHQLDAAMARTYADVENNPSKFRFTAV